MKKLRVIPAFLCICMVFGLWAPKAAAISGPVHTAQAVILADLDSGNILYEKNMYEQRSPASLTKIMTALIAVEAVERGDIALGDVITARDDCLQGIEEDSSTSGIVPGEEMSFENLLYCAMVQSASEACNIIGARLSGSIESFVNLMNRRAEELGCLNTHFSDTNGLSDENHYSTAYDLYLITREAIKHELFMTICNTVYHEVPPTNMSEMRRMNNSNALISDGSVYGADYIYKYAEGVKTGYTYAAGYCLISTAKKNDVHLMAIVLGCGGPMNTGEEEYMNFVNSRAIYEWGFRNFEYRDILSASEPMQRVEVQLAEGDGSLMLYPAKDYRLLLPIDVGEENTIRKITVYSDKLVAPVSAGTALGEVEVIAGDISYGKVKLICTSSVELSKSAYMKQSVRDYLEKPWVKLAAVGLILLLFIYIVLVIRYRRLRRQHLKERRLAEQRRNAARERRLVEEKNAAVTRRPAEERINTGSAELDAMLLELQQRDDDGEEDE